MTTPVSSVNLHSKPRRHLPLSSSGIDIAGLPYVINMTLPDPVENYVHRVGRVGRADCIGLAISLVAAGDIKEKARSSSLHHAAFPLPYSVTAQAYRSPRCDGPPT